MTEVPKSGAAPLDRPKRHLSRPAEDVEGDESNSLFLFSEQLEWPQSSVARRMVVPSTRWDASATLKAALPVEWDRKEERRSEKDDGTPEAGLQQGGGGTVPRAGSVPAAPRNQHHHHQLEGPVDALPPQLQQHLVAERGEWWSEDTRAPTASAQPPRYPMNHTTTGQRSSVPRMRSVMRAFVSDNPWETLHAQPALAVVGSTTALSMISAYVLQHHVLDTKDHMGVFLFGSYLVFSSYFMVYYFLERFSVSFRKISQDKKFYTISNLIKAGVLVSITPFAVWNLFRIVVHDEWETNTLRNLGCIYAIPDFVSMVAVRRMAWTTWLHHICVCVFNYFSIYNDYSQENVCRLIVVYAAFSTFAYCVNMLLASRFLGVSAQVSRVLSFVALCVYVLCCAVNWFWQAHYLNRLIQTNDHWTIYLYMTLICFVMWDDIVLNRWLLQNARNNHGLLMKGTRSVRAHEPRADAAAAPHGQSLPAQPRRGWRGACS